MELREAIDARRALRSFAQDPVPDGLVHDVMERVRLAPSCFNNQPWRFVFVREAGPLAAVKAALSRGNAWAQAAPMIVAVLSRRDLDCVIESPDRPPREYFLFDTGMAAAYLQLLLTEAGLVAHPIAGYYGERGGGGGGGPRGHGGRHADHRRPEVRRAVAAALRATAGRRARAAGAEARGRGRLSRPVCAMSA